MLIVVLPLKFDCIANPILLLCYNPTVKQNNFTEVIFDKYNTLRRVDNKTLSNSTT